MVVGPVDTSSELRFLRMLLADSVARMNLLREELAVLTQADDANVAEQDEIRRQLARADTRRRLTSNAASASNQSGS